MLDHKTIEISSNGKRFFRVSAQYVAALSSTLGVIIFCGGWVFGYMTFKADIKVITESVALIITDNHSLQERLNTMNQSISDDRQTLSNKITALETETKNVRSDIGDLKYHGGLKPN